MTDPGSEPARPSSLRVAAAGTVATTLVFLPVFMLGGLAALIQTDIAELDETRLGLAVSSFFGASALTTLFGGRLSEARGPRVGMSVAAVISAVSLIGLALAPSYAVIFVAAVLAGAANGMSQPASNLGIARGVVPARQGIAFGAKQSAIPLAGLIAGVSVPVIGLTLGWRWTFGLATVLVVAVLFIVPRELSGGVGRRRKGARADVPRTVLTVLAIGSGCASAGANSIGGFLVLSTMSHGIDAGRAGLLLATGSVVGVVTRLSAGWLADRRGREHLRVVVGMLVVGAVGYLMLALSGGRPVPLVFGTVVAFAGGWGWPGLIFLATVRLSPGGPGIGTAIIQAGGATGGVLGPLAFGIIVRASSFQLAWIVAGCLALLAAILIAVGRSMARAGIAAGRIAAPADTRRQPR